MANGTNNSTTNFIHEISEDEYMAQWGDNKPPVSTQENQNHSVQTRITHVMPGEKSTYFYEKTGIGLLFKLAVVVLITIAVINLLKKYKS